MNHLQDELMTEKVTIASVFVPQGQQGMDALPRRLGMGEGDMVRRSRAHLVCQYNANALALSDPLDECPGWRTESARSQGDALSTNQSPDPAKMRGGGEQRSANLGEASPT